MINFVSQSALVYFCASIIRWDINWHGIFQTGTSVMPKIISNSTQTRSLFEFTSAIFTKLQFTYTSIAFQIQDYHLPNYSILLFPYCVQSRSFFTHAEWPSGLKRKGKSTYSSGSCSMNKNLSREFELSHKH